MLSRTLYHSRLCLFIDNVMTTKNVCERVKAVKTKNTDTSDFTRSIEISFDPILNVETNINSNIIYKLYIVH